MVHQDVRIELVVKQLLQDDTGYVSVIFEHPIEFNYEAGDWIDVDFDDTNLRGGKTYSLSSSPTESDLTISFRKGISPFKRKLQLVRPGDKMYVSQYGNDYGFQLRNNRSSVLIAGGIGIAPFRSMLKEMVDLGGKNKVQLVYLNKSDEFLFKEELEEWKLSVPTISVEYITTKELKRKDREKLLKSLIKETNYSYYIAGPTGMVHSTVSFLEQLGVDAKDIRIDNFGTY